MSERVTVAEYAKHRGVSRQGIYKAIAAGRIYRDRDGWIDVQAADQQWHEATDPFRGGQAARASTSYPTDPALAEQTARLARAAQVVPELSRWADFIDRSAIRAGKLQDPEIDDFTNNPLQVHEFLYDRIANYLIDTGQVAAEHIDETDLILFPITHSQE